MAKINITCNCCKKVYNVNREPEIPAGVIALICNFCPECEDKMDNYYEEEFVYPKKDVLGNIIPDDISPNQLTIEF